MAPRKLLALVLSTGALLAATPLHAESLLKPKASNASNAGALLPVDQAFVLHGAKRKAGGAGKGEAVTLDWSVAPGYYLYNHMFKVTLDGAAGAALALQLPEGETKQDAEFGTVTVQRGALSIPVLGLPAGGKARTLRVRYQGCADIGVCYPPQTQLVALP
jgi:thiol:disulfide interchange protein DsbD